MRADRSMVGSPVEVDLTAFPKFKDAVGHYATLKDRTALLRQRL